MRCACICYGDAVGHPSGGCGGWSKRVSPTPTKWDAPPSCGSGFGALGALVWPDQPQRLARLDAAICVYHTVVTYQFSAAMREALESLLATAGLRRPVWHLSVEFDGECAILPSPWDRPRPMVPGWRGKKADFPHGLSSGRLAPPPRFAIFRPLPRGALCGNGTRRFALHARLDGHFPTQAWLCRFPHGREMDAAPGPGHHGFSRHFPDS